MGSPAASAYSFEQIDDHNIWVVDGPQIIFLGLPLPTRMTVIRLSNGDLFLHSPVKLSPELREKVDALGRVAFLVSPNKLHHMAIPEWKAAYPEAKSFASPGLQKKYKNFRFDAELADEAPSDWNGEIDQLIFRGSSFVEEVVFFHRASRTLILTDFIMNVNRKSVSALSYPIFVALGVLSPNGQAPSEVRWSFLFGKKKARACLERILAWQPERVVIAHGEWARENGEAFLRKGFRWLL